MVKASEVGGHLRQPLSHLPHCVIGQGLLNHLQAARAMWSPQQALCGAHGRILLLSGACSTALQGRRSEQREGL